MSWLGGLWGGEQGEQLDLEGVLRAIAALPPSADQMGRVEALMENMRDLVVRDAALRREDSLGYDIEEKGRAIVRHSLWVCLYFPACVPALRSALDCIAHCIKPPKQAADAEGKATGSYLHLVLTGVLFEPVQEVAQDPTLASSKQRQLPPSQLGLLLELLSQPDFYVRYGITDILCALFANGKGAEVQSAFLSQPMSLDRVCALLDDTRDALRMQALRLLLPLTETNVELQKLIAFGGAFETCLRLIGAGSSSWGDTTAMDCLRLMKNLLLTNISNQNYFRETSCLPMLKPLLEVGSAELWGALSEQKKESLLATLDIVLCMLSGTNPSISGTQQAIRQCGMQDQLITLGLNRINCPEIRSQAMLTLAAAIRGHTENRNEFAMRSILISGEDTPQPTLHRLLTLAFRSPSFLERTAAVAAFCSYLRDNAEGQLALASTMNPPPDSGEASSMGDAHAGANSIGRQLVAAFGASEEPVKNWLAGTMLAAVLADSDDCKVMSLRIPLSLLTSETLLQLATRQLRAEGGGEAAELVRVSVLQLLCTWLYECPAAVDALLADHTNFPFLVDTVLQPEGSAHVQGLSALLVGLCFAFNERAEDQSNNREAVHSLVSHRIGVHKFLAKLDGIRKNASFAAAEQDHAGTVVATEDGTNEISHILQHSLYTYDFASFFKSAYDLVVRELRSPGKRQEKDVTQTPQYKALLEAKNGEIAQLQAQLQEAIASTDAGNALAAEKEEKEPEVVVDTKALEELQARITLLEETMQEKDETIESLAQVVNDMEQMAAEQTAQLEEAKVQPAAPAAPASSGDGATEAQMAEFKATIESLEVRCQEYQAHAAALDVELAAAKAAVAEATAAQSQAGEVALAAPLQPSGPSDEMLEELAAAKAAAEASRSEAEKAREALALRDSALAQAEASCASARQQAEEARVALEETKAALSAAEEAAATAAAQAAPVTEAAGSALADEVDALKQEVKRLEEALAESETKYVILQGEQDEVLIMMAAEQVRNDNLEQRLLILEAQPSA